MALTNSLQEFTVPIWCKEGLHPAAALSSNGLKHELGPGVLLYEKPDLPHVPSGDFSQAFPPALLMAECDLGKLLVRNAAFSGNPRKKVRHRFNGLQVTCASIFHEITLDPSLLSGKGLEALVREAPQALEACGVRPWLCRAAPNPACFKGARV